jgi:hypothetical protein
MDALNRFASTAFRDSRSAALTLGVGTVALTHSIMFMFPSSVQDAQKQNHAAINLAAAGAIVYGSRMLG